MVESAHRLRLVQTLISQRIRRAELGLRLNAWTPAFLRRIAIVLSSLSPFGVNHDRAFWVPVAEGGTIRPRFSDRPEAPNGRSLLHAMRRMARISLRIESPR
jgi:hypothetical protein